MLLLCDHVAESIYLLYHLIMGFVAICTKTTFGFFFFEEPHGLGEESYVCMYINVLSKLSRAPALDLDHALLLRICLPRPCWFLI